MLLVDSTVPAQKRQFKKKNLYYIHVKYIWLHSMTGLITGQKWICQICRCRSTTRLSTSCHSHRLCCQKPAICHQARKQGRRLQRCQNREILSQSFTGNEWSEWSLLLIGLKLPTFALTRGSSCPPEVGFSHSKSKKCYPGCPRQSPVCLLLMRFLCHHLVKMQQHNRLTKNKREYFSWTATSWTSLCEQCVVRENVIVLDHYAKQPMIST